MLDPCSWLQRGWTPVPDYREDGSLSLATERVDPCPGCREGILEGFSLPVFWTHCQVVMRIFVSASRDPVWNAQSENNKQSRLGFGGLGTAPSVGSPVSAGACAGFQPLRRV